VNESCGLNRDSIILLEQVRTLDKKRLRERDDPEEVKELRSLIRIIEAGPEVMTEFNPILFNNIVRSISVAKEDFLAFHLMGGLILKETIQRRTGR